MLASLRFVIFVAVSVNFCVGKSVFVSSTQRDTRIKRVVISQRAGTLNEFHNKLIDQSYKHLFNGELEKAYHLAKSVVKNGEDVKTRANGNALVGDYFFQTSRYDSAYFYYNKARKLYTELNLTKEIAKLNLSFAAVLYETNYYYEAERCVFSALNLTKRIKDSELIRCNAYAILALIYTDCHEFDEAIKYNNKAINIIRNRRAKINGNMVYENLLNNQGFAYQTSGNYSEAIEYFSLALEQKEFHTNLPLYAAILDNLTYCRIQLGSYDNAENDFLKALGLRRKLKQIPGEIQSKLHLGEYYNKVGNFQKSIYYLKSAYVQSRLKRLPVERTIALQQLIKTDPSNQAKYIDEYIKLSDSLKIAERKNHNKFARIAYETDEIIQEKENALRQKRLLIGSGSAAVLICGLIGIIFYQRARNRKLQIERLQQDANNDIFRLLNARHLEITRAREQEKKRIARDLHDGIMNRLSGTRLNLETLKHNRDSETINRCLGYINQIQEIEKEIRCVSHDLNHASHPSVVNFETMLEALLDDYTERLDAELHVEIQLEDWSKIPNTVKIAVYRVLQESLGNCSKYANASNVFVNIGIRDSQLLLTINDDGYGFNIKSKKKGIGLKNMKARVKALKGKFTLTSSPNVGTSIQIVMPISNDPTLHESN